MSATKQSTTPAAHSPTYTDEDVQALFASVEWFDFRASSQRIQQYRGMHAAIYGEELIDADSDGDELYQRVAAKGNVPIKRVLFREIPTGDGPIEALTAFIG